MKIEVHESTIEGRGLFAVVPIPAGVQIFEDAADDPDDVVMTDDEFQAYIKTVDRYSARSIGDGLHQVSMNPDSILSFGNHSCDPNMWLDLDHVTLVARRDIREDEEITSDYALWSDTAAWSMRCNCGSECCRGVITGLDWQRPDLQVRYQGRWPEFLEQKIARNRR